MTDHATPPAALPPSLRAPFPEHQVRFKPGGHVQQGKRRYAIPQPYLDALTIYQRLDEAVGPGKWSTTLKRQSSGVYTCFLTIEGVTRTGVGTAAPSEPLRDKAAAQDALRSAALAFGIGTELEGLAFEPVRLQRQGREWRFASGWQPSAMPTQGAVKGKAARPAPTDPATDVQLYRIEREAYRVGWDEEREKAHLIDTVGKPSRFELTVEEASALLRHLRVLSSRTRSR